MFFLVPRSYGPGFGGNGFSLRKACSSKAFYTVPDKKCLIVPRGVPAKCPMSWAVGRFQPDQPYCRVPKHACIMPTMLPRRGQKEFGAFSAGKSGQAVRAFGQEIWKTTLPSSSPKCKGKTWSFGAEKCRFPLYKYI